jgi:hypothetical protein
MALEFQLVPREEAERLKLLEQQRSSRTSEYRDVIARVLESPGEIGWIRLPEEMAGHDEHGRGRSQERREADGGQRPHYPEAGNRDLRVPAVPRPG